MLPRAVTSPELARLRLGGQWSEVCAVIVDPTIVYRARVNGTPTPIDRLVDITYDSASGTLANVFTDYTFWVGSTLDGYEKGQGRIRSTPSSSVFHIGIESEIDIADNDYLTVVSEFGLWQKRVKIDAGVIYLDNDVVYSDQHTNRKPVVVMGGPVVLEILPGLSTAIASFDASPSWVPGGGAATYVWVCPGAASSTGLTTATPTMTYNAAGRYQVGCSVTIGGVVSTKYEYVYVFDSTHPPVTQFQFRGLTGAKGSGYSWQMTMLAEAGLATVRDRAMVILFTRDYFGTGGRVSQGYATGRENILAVGWIDGESIVWSPELGSVTFDVQGAHAWLDRVTAYPQGLEDVTTTPALWTDYNTLTLTALLWHLLVWRSTAAQALDCIVEQTSVRTVELQAAATSLWEQITILAQRQMAAPSTDHLGRLFVLIDSQLRTDRSGIVEVMTLTKPDWRPPMTLNRVTVPPVSMVDLSGFSFDGTDATALFSLAPGHVWRRYGRVQTVQAQLLTDQAQANHLAGLALGQANNEYPTIPIQLAANNRFLDVAPDCYALLTLAAADTPRGISFTNKRLIPRRISWSYDASTGVLLPAVDFEAESSEQLAVTGDAPATDPIPPVLPPEPEACPSGYHWDADAGACVPDGSAVPGDASHVTVASQAALGYTTNFLDPSPNWTAKNPSLSGGEVIRDFLLDPYDPVNSVYLLTDKTLYHTADYQSSPPTWSTIYTLAAASTDSSATIVNFMRLEASIAERNYIGLLGAVSGAFPNLWYFHTHDASSFHAAQVSKNGAPSGSTEVGAFAISQHDAANIWVGTSSGGTTGALRASTDGGHTFASIWSAASFYSPLCVHVQYAGNADDAIILVAGGRESALDAFVYRTLNGFTGITDISPSTVHTTYADGGGVDRVPAARVLLVPVTDADRIFLLGSRSLDKRGTEGVHMLVSTDAGATWANRHSFAGSVNAIGAWPWEDSNKLYAVGNGTDGYILYSDDEGTTWVDKLGDWASAIGAFGTGVNVVPTWLAV